MTLDRTLITALALTTAWTGSSQAPGPDLSASAPVANAAFIENKGQLPGQVLYRADFGTVALFAERQRITWSKLQDDAGEVVHEQSHTGNLDASGLTLHGHAWRMDLVGADPAAAITRSGRSSAWLNYFVGNDPAKWASDVHFYSEIRYEQPWPGVDLRLHSSKQGGFKYDVELAHAADVAQVRFAYDGLNGVKVDREGRLVMRTSVGDVMEMAPVAWYADGAKEPVGCAFTVTDGVVGFRLEKGVDPQRPVVIDPVLMASTLSGTGNIGTTQNYGHTATYDDLGNIYTGAICFGQGYPATPGAFDLTFGGGFGVDIAVSKLNPDGSALLYATYLGGNGGDYPHSLIVTPAEELVVYGSSDSPDYPVSAGAYDPSNNGGVDIVLTKLNTNGTALVGSTYIGTSNTDGRNNLTWNYGDSYRGEVLCDALGRVYVSSCTDAANFPTTAGAYQTVGVGGQEGVVFRLNNDLSALDWSTYLSTPGGDMCFGLKLDAAGDVYVCGATDNAAFPTTPGAYQTAFTGTEDGFIAHLTGNGSTLAHSTLFGSSQEVDAFFIQLDVDGDVYIYGQSTLGTITISPPGTYGQPGTDIFIAEFTPDLATNIFKSVVGTAGGFGTSCVPVAFLVDVCEHIYISGYSTYGGGFATTAGALYTTGGFYLAAYDVDMSGILYGTYYDGAGHVDGGTSRFDSNGIVYQAVCTAGVFPTTPWAYSNVQPAGWDIGVFKIDFQVAGVNAAGASTVNSGCAPILIDFLNTSTGTNWIWDFGDGSVLDTAYTPSHLYTTPGSYTVTLIAYDSLACNLADTVQFPVTIGTATPIVADFTAVQSTDCTLSQVVTTNTSTGAPLGFEWDMGDGTFYTDTNVTHAYAAPGVYDIELLVYDPTGCSQPDSLTQQITINPPVTVDAAFTATQVPDCSQLLVSTTNLSIGPSPSFIWDMGDGTVYASFEVIDHLYAAPGLYTITLIANDAGTCNLADTTTLQVQVDPAEPVTAAFTIDQAFDCAQMLGQTTNTSTGSFLLFQWDMGDGTTATTENVTHTYTTPGTYDITLVVIDSLGCSPNDTAFAQVTIDPLEPVVADFTLGQIGDCTTLTVQGINESTGDSVSYSWDMGDGTVLTTTDVTHVYTGPGTYTVTLTVTDLGCGQDDSMTATVDVINELPTPLVTDAVVCFGTTVTLDATTPDVSDYLWSTGATTPTITVASGGDYIVEVFTEFCYGTDTVHVVEGTDPELSYELEACPEEHLDISVPMEGQSYSWSTGGTDRTEHVIGDGTYVFTVIDFLGCPHTDTVIVHPLDSDATLFAPNAFTPDGDGINDVFAVTGFGEERTELLIFDRWGEQLYATTDLSKPWDGTYSGALVKQDVYVYRLKYNAHCDQGNEKLVYGHVSVLH